MVLKNFRLNCFVIARRAYVSYFEDCASQLYKCLLVFYHHLQIVYAPTD